MANEDKIVFPNGRRLSEFTLSGSGGGTITGSGTNNILTMWTGQSTINNSPITDNGTTLTANRNLNISANYITNCSYIEGMNGTNSLQLFSYGNGTAGVTVQAAKVRVNYDFHIGSNSGFLKDNAGDIELHLATGKKLKIVVG